MSSASSFIALVTFILLTHTTLASAAPMHPIPFQWEYGLIFVDVLLPGQPPRLALLDTGANTSAIDPRCSAEAVALDSSEVVGTTGTVTSEIVQVDSLRLGSLLLPPLRATRRALTGLAPEGRSLDLILGSDALAHFALTIDFATHQLLFNPSATEDSSNGIAMNLDQGIPAIEASLGGLSTWLRIDTGASLFATPDVYVNIPTVVWEELCKLHPDLHPSTQFQGAGADGKPVELPVARIPRAQFGLLELDHAFVIVQPEIGYFANPKARGFVSNNFLEKLGRVTLDYPAGRLR